MCVRVISFQLVMLFTSRRTKAKVDPPAALPNVTDADTQSQFSAALSARFHSCSRVNSHLCGALPEAVPRTYEGLTPANEPHRCSARLMRP